MAVRMVLERFGGPRVGLAASFFDFGRGFIDVFYYRVFQLFEMFLKRSWFVLAVPGAFLGAPVGSKRIPEERRGNLRARFWRVSEFLGGANMVSGGLRGTPRGPWRDLRGPGGTRKGPEGVLGRPRGGGQGCRRGGF